MEIINRINQEQQIMNNEEEEEEEIEFLVFWGFECESH